MTEDPNAGESVLLVADPGLPTQRAHSIQDELQQLLDEAFSQPIQLHVHTSMLKLRPDNSLDLSDASDLAREYSSPDAVLLLTEIPRLKDGRPLVAEIFPEEKIAVVSCPTLGGVVTKRRIIDTLMACTLRMKPTQEQSSDPTRFERAWSHWHRSSEPGAHFTLEAHRGTGSLRTIFGMIIGNEPFRTIPKLSSALAAAVATGAFGIFYSSIWAMTTYLSTPRLLGIGAATMLVMTAWLIISNDLWDRPKFEKLGRVVLLYNLSTVATLVMSVFGLYLALVALILVGGLIVIAPGYMGEMISEQPSFSNYLDIAWLSASMGVVGGALGSGFDQRAELRNLTHGQRERQRQYTEKKS